MSLLSRYLLRQNLFLMFTVLSVGIGLYLLSDLFDRLDDFLEASVGVGIIATYFLSKIPLIISQILPAVFLIACILQLCFMARARELVALQAGGVSFARMASFFILYGLVWAVVQLCFSQFLGVKGEELSARIWREEVRKKSMEAATLHSVWFTEGDYMVHLGRVQPARNMGEDITVYELDGEGRNILQVLRAKSFTVDRSGWLLKDVRILDPGMFTTGRADMISLSLRQDVAAFQAIDPRADLQKLPLWKLWDAIAQLQASGSNVEGLRTVFHMKLAYSGSLVVMGLVALMLLTWKDNLYFCVGVGLVITFAYYALFTLGGSLGEKGMVYSVMAAWGADILFATVAGGRILWFTRSRGRIRFKDGDGRRKWGNPHHAHPIVRRKEKGSADTE